MRYEKLYKNWMAEVFLTCSNGFYYTQNEQPPWQYQFLSYWKSFEEFLFYIYSKVQKSLPSM
jgi:hypothetical protein